MQKILITIATVIVLAGVGVAGYFYFFADTAGIEVAPTAEGTGLPVAGQEMPGETETPATPDTTVVSAPTSVSARLVQISKGPVVPGAVVTSRAATASSSAETLVTYIERQSGNVFSYNVSSRALVRTSNRTVPGILSAAWLPNASRAFVRYLSGEDDYRSDDDKYPSHINI